MKPVNLVWFRRDLRLEDQRALARALGEPETESLGLFIFDTNILSKLWDRADARVSFIHRTLVQMQSELQKRGSDLIVLHGSPIDLWSRILRNDESSPLVDLLKGRQIGAVFCNQDYEPAAIARDEAVRSICKERAVRFESFKDQVVFDFSDVVKDDGLPYTVYTPYSRKWLGQLSSADLLSEQCSKNYVRLFQSRRSAWVLPSLEALGFSNSKIEISGPKVPTSLLTEYGKVRDLPAVKGTSRLGTHLRFGTVSIRRAAAKARELGAEVWMKELIWREFFMQILYRFPHVTTRSFRAEYDRIKWKSDEEGFQAWCEGRTGVPIVDAGMRELNATGFMHNRVRMITASYLTKHLLVDWRRGEEYFAQKLLDFDLSANNGNWQWVAGSGCDAAPYFRVFNPELQAKKFDPENQYIRTWVPEFESSTYPAPLVEHPFARERALRAYAVVKR